jgi:hypothetical protein
LRHKISTDQFTELIRIEKEYGPVNLENFNNKNMDQIPIERKKASGWSSLSMFLKFNKRQWNTFLTKLSKAKDESLTDHEQERARLLALFLS